MPATHGYVAWAALFLRVFVSIVSFVYSCSPRESWRVAGSVLTHRHHARIFVLAPPLPALLAMPQAATC